MLLIAAKNSISRQESKKVNLKVITAKQTSSSDSFGHPVIDWLVSFAPLISYSILIAVFYLETDGFNQQDILFYCSLKSAPVFFLSFLAYLGQPHFKGQKRFQFAIGVILCGSGDFLLSTNEFGFTIGVISFGIGHMFYVAYFGSLLHEVSLRIVFAFLMCAYLTVNLLVRPYFTNTIERHIVSIYAYLIASSAIVACSLFFKGSANGKSGKDFWQLALGYLLFGFSDTVILLDKLNFPLPYAKSVIMFTYYGAQYLIFHNASNASASIQKVQDIKKKED
ncbi:hypothetical protein M3Y97_00700700 [Aphelenchoides bicaudatus]|nr:hypothetical protein M3Y97_00700700 [Aphelenchoides bicaudatus]